mmetsp:Transcript_20637/g.63024  ORF Transcript_20637/g.63024 Transcript_20637/m.63024 type:complete len:268 (+) Transcript_20637:1824-2627(+)
MAHSNVDTLSARAYGTCAHWLEDLAIAHHQRQVASDMVPHRHWLSALGAASLELCCLHSFVERRRGPECGGRASRHARLCSPDCHLHLLLCETNNRTSFSGHQLARRRQPHFSKWYAAHVYVCAPALRACPRRSTHTHGRRARGRRAGDARMVNRLLFALARLIAMCRPLLLGLARARYSRGRRAQACKHCAPWLHDLRRRWCAPSGAARGRRVYRPSGAEPHRLQAALHSTEARLSPQVTPLPDACGRAYMRKAEYAHTRRQLRRA